MNSVFLFHGYLSPSSLCVTSTSILVFSLSWYESLTCLFQKHTKTHASMGLEKKMFSHTLVLNQEIDLNREKQEIKKCKLKNWNFKFGGPKTGNFGYFGIWETPTTGKTKLANQKKLTQNWQTKTQAGNPKLRNQN